jgi:hypothetical protein
MENQIQVLENTDALNQLEKASIDMQIATAKAYPRSIKRSLENAIATVTLNEKTASTCGYVLRFRGNEIKGKSVYLAKILSQSWGNLRTAQRIIGADATHVMAEGICFDLETNISHTVMVKKPILKKDGTRYSADMIATMGMAAASIAVRNAILSVIPQSVSDEVYDAAARKMIGSLSKEDRLISKRKEMLDLFSSKYEVKEEQILKHFNVRSIEQLDPMKVKEMIDMDTAFTEGTLNIDEIFSLPTDEENNKSYAEDLKDAEKKPDPPKNQQAKLM